MQGLRADIPSYSLSRDNILDEFEDTRKKRVSAEKHIPTTSRDTYDKESASDTSLQIRAEKLASKLQNEIKEFHNKMLKESKAKLEAMVEEEKREIQTVAGDISRHCDDSWKDEIKSFFAGVHGDFHHMCTQLRDEAATMKAETNVLLRECSIQMQRMTEEFARRRYSAPIEEQWPPYMPTQLADRRGRTKSRNVMQERRTRYRRERRKDSSVRPSCVPRLDLSFAHSDDEGVGNAGTPFSGGISVYDDEEYITPFDSETVDETDYEKEYLRYYPYWDAEPVSGDEESAQTYLKMVPHSGFHYPFPDVSFWDGQDTAISGGKRDTGLKKDKLKNDSSSSSASSTDKKYTFAMSIKPRMQPGMRKRNKYRKAVSNKNKRNMDNGTWMTCNDLTQGTHGITAADDKRVDIVYDAAVTPSARRKRKHRGVYSVADFESKATPRKRRLVACSYSEESECEDDIEVLANTDENGQLCIYVPTAEEETRELDLSPISGICTGDDNSYRGILRHAFSNDDATSANVSPVSMRIGLTEDANIGNITDMRCLADKEINKKEEIHVLSHEDEVIDNSNASASNGQDSDIIATAVETAIQDGVTGEEIDYTKNLRTGELSNEGSKSLQSKEHAPEEEKEVKTGDVKSKKTPPPKPKRKNKPQVSKKEETDAVMNTMQNDKSNGGKHSEEQKASKESLNMFYQISTTGQKTSVENVHREDGFQPIVQEVQYDESPVTNNVRYIESNTRHSLEHSLPKPQNGEGKPKRIPPPKPKRKNKPSPLQKADAVYSVTDEESDVINEMKQAEIQRSGTQSLTKSPESALETVVEPDLREDTSVQDLRYNESPVTSDKPCDESKSSQKQKDKVQDSVKEVVMTNNIAESQKEVKTKKIAPPKPKRKNKPLDSRKEKAHEDMVRVESDETNEGNRASLADAREVKYGEQSVHHDDRKENDNVMDDSLLQQSRENAVVSEKGGKVGKVKKKKVPPPRPPPPKAKIEKESSGQVLTNGNSEIETTPKPSLENLEDKNDKIVERKSQVKMNNEGCQKSVSSVQQNITEITDTIKTHSEQTIRNKESKIIEKEPELELKPKTSLELLEDEIMESHLQAKSVSNECVQQVEQDVTGEKDDEAALSTHTDADLNGVVHESLSLESVNSFDMDSGDEGSDNDMADHLPTNRSESFEATRMEEQSMACVSNITAGVKAVRDKHQDDAITKSKPIKEVSNKQPIKAGTQISDRKPKLQGKSTQKEKTIVSRNKEVKSVKELRKQPNSNEETKGKYKQSVESHKSVTSITEIKENIDEIELAVDGSVEQSDSRESVNSWDEESADEQDVDSSHEDNANKLQSQTCPSNNRIVNTVVQHEKTIDAQDVSLQSISEINFEASEELKESPKIKHVQPATGDLEDEIEDIRPTQSCESINSWDMDSEREEYDENSEDEDDDNHVDLLSKETAVKKADKDFSEKGVIERSEMKRGKESTELPGQMDKESLVLESLSQETIDNVDTDRSEGKRHGIDHHKNDKKPYSVRKNAHVEDSVKVLSKEHVSKTDGYSQKDKGNHKRKDTVKEERTNSASMSANKLISKKLMSKDNGTKSDIESKSDTHAKKKKEKIKSGDIDRYDEDEVKKETVKDKSRKRTPPKGSPKKQASTSSRQLPQHDIKANMDMEDVKKKRDSTDGSLKECAEAVKDILQSFSYESTTRDESDGLTNLQELSGTSVENIPSKHKKGDEQYMQKSRKPTSPKVKSKKQAPTSSRQISQLDIKANMDMENAKKSRGSTDGSLKECDEAVKDILQSFSYESTTHDESDGLKNLPERSRKLEENISPEHKKDEQYPQELDTTKNKHSTTLNKKQPLSPESSMFSWSLDVSDIVSAKKPGESETAREQQDIPDFEANDDVVGEKSNGMSRRHTFEKESTTPDIGKPSDWESDDSDRDQCESDDSSDETDDERIEGDKEGRLGIEEEKLDNSADESLEVGECSLKASESDAGSFDSKGSHTKYRKNAGLRLPDDPSNINVLGLSSDTATADVSPNGSESFHDEQQDHKCAKKGKGKKKREDGPVHTLQHIEQEDIQIGQQLEFPLDGKPMERTEGQEDNSVEISEGSDTTKMEKVRAEWENLYRQLEAEQKERQKRKEEIDKELDAKRQEVKCYHVQKGTDKKKGFASAIKSRLPFKKKNAKKLAGSKGECSITEDADKPDESVLKQKCEKEIEDLISQSKRQEQYSKQREKELHEQIKEKEKQMEKERKAQIQLAKAQKKKAEQMEKQAKQEAKKKAKEDKKMKGKTSKEGKPDSYEDEEAQNELKKENTKDGESQVEEDPDSKKPKTRTVKLGKYKIGLQSMKPPKIFRRKKGTQNEDKETKNVVENKEGNDDESEMNDEENNCDKTDEQEEKKAKKEQEKQEKKEKELQNKVEKKIKMEEKEKIKKEKKEEQKRKQEEKKREKEELKRETQEQKEIHKEHKALLDTCKNEEKDKLEKIVAFRKLKEKEDQERRVKEIIASKKEEIANVIHEKQIEKDIITEDKEIKKEEKKIEKDRMSFEKRDEKHDKIAKEKLDKIAKFRQKQQEEIERLKQLIPEEDFEQLLGLKTVDEEDNVSYTQEEGDKEEEESYVSDSDTEEGYRPTKPKCIADGGLRETKEVVEPKQVMKKISELFDDNVDNSDEEFGCIDEPDYEKKMRRKEKREARARQQQMELAEKTEMEEEEESSESFTPPAQTETRPKLVKPSRPPVPKRNNFISEEKEEVVEEKKLKEDTQTSEANPEPEESKELETPSTLEQLDNVVIVKAEPKKKQKMKLRDRLMRDWGFFVKELRGPSYYNNVTPKKNEDQKDDGVKSILKQSRLGEQNFQTVSKVTINPNVDVAKIELVSDAVEEAEESKEVEEVGPIVDRDCIEILAADEAFDVEDSDHSVESHVMEEDIDDIEDFD